jgi:hypothetical protein
MIRVRLGPTLLALTGALVHVACGPAEPAGPPTPGVCDAEAMALERQAVTYLQATCAQAGCHLPVGPQWPSFAAADLPEFVASERFPQLLERMDPADPADIMPPTRAANPPAEVALVRAWVEAGAPTGCITPPPRPAPAPNTLDQDALFTCALPAEAPPGPPRVRRVGNPEWVHAIGGVLTEPSLVANPFGVTSGPYSTFVADEPIDPSSLLLSFDALAATHTLPSWAYQPWYARDLRGLGVDSTCMRTLAGASDLPDEACREAFIDASFQLATHARAPSPAERALLRGFLDEVLDASRADLEAQRARLRSESGDAAAELDPATLVARRQRALDEVFDASFMLFGALHRREAGDATGRLTADELAIALAGALTTYLPTGVAPPHRHPRPDLAWIPAFREAQRAGTLDTDAGVRGFVASFFALASGFAGGRSALDATYRAELQRDYGRYPPDRRAARRGEYWLAPRIAGFFREYFDYGGVASVAKDDAGETSRWDLRADALGHDELVSAGYGLIVGGTVEEPGMVDQLDDTIARMVVEAELGGQDVLGALLLGRTYRVPAVPYTLSRPLTGTACDPYTCTERECCEGRDERCLTVSFGTDGRAVGVCSATYPPIEWFHAARMYDVGAPILEDATRYPASSVETAQSIFDLLLTDAAHDARWVEFPASERAGVLTHPTWLAAHGGNAENDASLVLRGRWIREHLFCESVAGLELVELDASLRPSADTSARARIREAMGPGSGDARCANAACHGRMNSLGLPFEIFNHAGFRRVTDHGSAPDGSSIVEDWPGRDDLVEIDDALTLARELAGDPHARRCFLRHVFRYFMGRYETPADACTLHEMETAFEGGSLMNALAALYGSHTFLHRATTEVEP